MKILFIGNSHTYFNDMPHLFTCMCRESAGLSVEPVLLSYSGRSLEWHMKEYFSVRWNLLYGHYDCCVIQQAAHPFPSRETTMEYGEDLIRLCQSAGTKPILFMTWAEKEKPENQIDMIETYSALSKKTGALLAPVGIIWQKIRQEHPEINLFWADGEHASPYGSYLTASTLCRCITGQSSLELSNRGLDFTQGMDLSFTAPKVIEEPEKVFVLLNPEYCHVINQAVMACTKNYMDKN